MRKKVYFAALLAAFAVVVLPAATSKTVKVAHAAASNAQANLTAADYVTGEPFSDINDAVTRLYQPEGQGVGPPGTVWYSSIGIQGCAGVTLCTGSEGLIQAGWITSHGDPSAVNIDSCITVGTVIRGYFLEWRNDGVGQPYNCVYVPTTAAKWGDAKFEIVEPSSTWRILKDGKTVGPSSITLNWTQGYAVLRLEWIYGAGTGCGSYQTAGNSDPGTADNYSFKIRHVGGSLFNVSAVQPYISSEVPSGWHVSFIHPYQLADDNHLHMAYFGENPGGICPG